ncbi:MAG: sensor histidine kinase [Hydrogenophilales bacterium CG_4_9_14_3_um_filter_63_34]|nr:MAG: sensor histidine kinase [Hydrogenophilales bacterium CG_4_9_14_3_um_filter_63_34]
MKHDMNSIRSKIILIYLALALGVGAFVLFASVSLRFVERRVNEGVAIAAFQETAQELRRHEKNFFLYRAPADLDAARGLAAELQRQLEKERAVLAELAQPDELPSLSRALLRYRRQLDGGGMDEAVVRGAGHEILTRSETLAARERTALSGSVRQSRHTLLGSVGVLVLLALAGGQVLFRVVGRPLRQLEKQLEPLAQGQFRAFSMVSNDREIVSFTQALNSMLEELEVRRRQVLQSEKLASLGTLASGVAHELNNPLGNISGAAQIALEEIESLPDAARAALRSWLRQIDDETERARQIVRILLDYSRRPGHDNRPTPLREVLEKSLLLLRPRLPADDTVSLDVPGELKLCIDPQRMQQVFINLIQNALAAGGERVHIHIEAAPAGPRDWPPAEMVAGPAQILGTPLGTLTKTAGAVLIHFRDDGPGIPPERIGQVFDPFFTTRAPGEGTGLGLYIVGEIVQEHGGAIAVTSPPGGGTLFILWLPCGETP